MITTGGLAATPSTRIDAKNGKLTLTDGPFTETKELMDGFAIFEVASKELRGGPAFIDEALGLWRCLGELHPVAHREGERSSPSRNQILIRRRA